MFSAKYALLSLWHWSRYRRLYCPETSSAHSLSATAPVMVEAQQHRVSQACSAELAKGFLTLLNFWSYLKRGR